MKKQTAITVPNKKKIVFISILYTIAMIIIFLGMFFCIFSLANHINFKILNSSIPGAIFGFLVLYLGIKYYFSVCNLKSELFKTSSKFSWSNFKGKKVKKIIYKK
jgi:small-conductance mechanosensitive channel